MAGGKWISGLTADTSLADAARRVLTVRLELVRDHLPPALQQAQDDPEHVHQLRVATRRARAALDVFADCLPAKAYKHARRKLRNLRRAAGEARDWDVFLLTLLERQSKFATRQKPGFDFLTGYAMGQRRTAQIHLLETGRDQPFACDLLLAETVAAVHKPHDDRGETVLIDLARPRLATLLKDLDAGAQRDLHDYAQLHQVRITGKRLRYAMEIVADCFEPAFKEELYPAVEQMQDILGNANDSHVAIDRLTELANWTKATMGAAAKRVLPGIDALLRYHKERLRSEGEHFLAWWQRWQETGGEAALAVLLKGVGVGRR
jgi:CHAD domain-containing protein